jgi:manganese/iron transport system permease protein
MIDLVFWAPVMTGGAVAGASSGVLGTFIVGMRIPFLGVCVAHAALAGAVFGGLCGLTGQHLLWPALAGAVVTALALGLLDPRRFHLDDNTVLSFLFSATMGLAFLGIGLYGILGKSDNDVRSLLWGSLNFCRWTDVRLMLLTSTALGGFVALFFKELRAILFSRADAEAAGIRATAVWTGFLVLTAATLTVNFQTVGGLMIYSLISNPAAAAFQVGRGFRQVLCLSALLGATSGLGGFLIAAATDLPSGAVIVLVSSALVGTAALARRWRAR